MSASKKENKVNQRSNQANVDLRIISQAKISELSKCKNSSL